MLRLIIIIIFMFAKNVFKMREKSWYQVCVVDPLQLFGQELFFSDRNCVHACIKTKLNVPLAYLKLGQIYKVS